MRVTLGQVLIASVFVGVMAAPSGVYAAINVAPSPILQSIIEGNVATVDIRIGGLGVGEAPSVGAYDLDVTFDPLVLSFVAATFGDDVLGNQLDLFGLGNVSSITPSTGMVNLFELSLDTAADLNALQATTFVIASLRFSGLSVGSSPIGVTVNALGDADGASLLATISSGSIVVAAVPEPSIYAMMLAGLGIVGAMVHKRRKGVLR